MLQPIRFRPHSRRLWIFLASVVLLGTISCRSEMKAYNVLFVVSDALRADVLGCYGGEAHTPNMDRLASRGVLFKNAFSVSPRTLTSAVAMFTARYSSTYPYRVEKKKILKYFVPARDRLFGETLREAGYDVRKRMENRTAEISNNLQGFEELPSGKNLTQEIVRHIMHETGIRIRNQNYRGLLGILYYLLTVPPDRPFFTLQWFLDPHSYYDPPPSFKQTIEVVKDNLPRPLDIYSRFHFRGGDLPYSIRGQDLTESELDYVKQLYIKEVESVDERLGYLLAALRAKKLLDSTLIVLTSDHGEAFGEHGKFGHGQSFFNVHLHVPLIIAGPDIPKNKQVATVVTQLDLIPTIMEYLGLPKGDSVQGRSFLPLLIGEGIPRDFYYFAGAWRQVKYRDAIIMGDFKLSLFKWRGQHELYNLAADPEEKSNLARSDPDRLRQMLRLLKNIRKENVRLRLRSSDRLGDTEKMGEDEKKRILKDMRTLGYIK